MIGVLRRERAGRSAVRRYKTLSREWRRRTFGRRAGLLAYLVLALGLVVVVYDLDLSPRWSLGAGIVWGMTAMTTQLFPELLMPAHIQRWQLGALGEENTAGELRPLRRRGWTIRHDLAWGRGNHDHLVARDSVFVLNSKYLADSRVTVEGAVLRVTRIDNPEDSYLADRWVGAARREADSLERRLRKTLGWGVAVYPVIVVWGGFAGDPVWLDSVCVLHGRDLVTFLESRPPDLLHVAKREQVAQALRGLPRAS
jgi:hypothetical protein